jgi:hypothetical protein
MNAYCARVLERNRKLQERLDLQQLTIEDLISRLQSHGVSCTGSSTPCKKCPERQHKESQPTLERPVRESQSHPRETPGNEPVVDPAYTPASWSSAEDHTPR